MYPGVEDRYKAELIAKVARIVAEAGADFKTFYTGDKNSFRRAVEGGPVPIVILGGLKIENDEEMLAMVGDVPDAGARGIAFWMNVWQRGNLAAMVKRLSKLVHGES